MKLFRLLALAACLLAPLPALADGGSNILGGGGGGGGGNVTVVGPVGTLTAPSSAVSVAIVSGASASTGFNLAVTGTPFTATTGGVTSAGFTSSAEVVVTNVGTTNGAYCAPGASATTSSQYIAPNGGWFAFYNAIGITQISCITSTSTTTINIAAGSGLPTGTGGGGGGGGGGGTVAQGNAGSAGQSWFITPTIGGVAVDATHGSFVNILQGNSTLGATNGIYANVLQGNAVLGATNGLYANLLQGNVALSSANGIFVAPTSSAVWAQGNAGSVGQAWFMTPAIAGALNSATNGLYVNLLQGNSVVGAGNPVFANIVNGVSGTSTGVACGTLCTIGVQGNVTATDVPVSVAGTGSNTGSAFASSATNVKTMAFAYGYNGASWDQLQVDGSKFLKVNVAAGSISAATGFNVAVTGTPFNATTGGVTSASFTSETEVVVTNVGTTNGAYCAPGVSATTSSQYIAPNGGWFAFYNGSGITQITCITAASTTTINIVAGAGLPTGTGGGGGGGGGGGTVAQGNAGTAAQAWFNAPTIGGVAVDSTHGSFVDLLQGDVALSSTNGIYSNLLQGNAVISATNGIYANLLQGNAALSTSNGVYVLPTSAATWAATESGTWNITNISGTVSLPTGAATAALQASPASIASPTTTGGTGYVAMGAATTAAPTDTTGNAYPLSLTTGGALRVADASVVTALGSPFQAGGSIGNTTFAATQSGTWNITNVSGTVSLPTGAATSANQTNASAKTQIVDGSGNVIASTSNNLNVQCANCSGSGVSTADEASFTAGASLFAGAGGFFQTTATNNALTTGQQGLFQVTANRALFSNLRNAAGTEVGTSTTPLQVSLANTGSNATAVLVTQGNAGSAGQAWFAAPTAAGAVLSATNGLFVLPTTAATWAATESGTWNITNVSGTVSLPTGASTAALQPTNAAAESTSSGQTGTVAMGFVTTAAPTYTTAKSDPLSLTVGGALRVADASVVTALGSPFQAGGSIGNTSFAATQSGTWNITNISGTVSLPTGAATATNQTGGSQKTQLVDGSGNVITATNVPGYALNVDCIAGCGSGTISNASSGVATSTTNSGAVSYLYGFNSASWDQVLTNNGYLFSAVNITNPASGAITRVATAVSETPSTTTGQCTTNFLFTKTGAQVFLNGQTVIFTALPCPTTGPAINTPYYVISAGANTFALAATPGGTSLLASGTPASQTAFLVYAPGDNIANNGTAGSITVQSISTAARNASGSFFIRRIRLVTNDTTAAWAGMQTQVSLWSAAPTYGTYGDAAPYTLATGSASYLGSFNCTFIAMGDGAACTGAPTVGDEVAVALASGTTIYWDLQVTGSNYVAPVASKTFTLTLEDWRN